MPQTCAQGLCQRALLIHHLCLEGRLLPLALNGGRNTPVSLAGQRRMILPVLHLPKFPWPCGEVSTHLSTAVQRYWLGTRQNCWLSDRNFRCSRKEWRTGIAKSKGRCQQPPGSWAHVPSAQPLPGKAGQNAGPTAGWGAPALHNRSMMTSTQLFMLQSHLT